MELVIPKQVRKELEEVPNALKLDAFSLIEELLRGVKLGMPISRPLPSIAKGLHKLRLSDRAGQLRVFYLIKHGECLYILHVARKKTEKITPQTADLIRKRIKEHIQ